jgi:hypothetical protein
LNPITKDIEPLLFCPSPRDLTEFYTEFNKITNYDKYFVRYTRPEIQAYDWGRDAFLSDKKYTHLVICPDDLIIKQKDVNRIYLDLLYLQTLGLDQSTCIGGFCNLNTTDMKDLSNICIDRVNIDRYPNRRYNFATLQYLRDYPLLYSSSKNMFIKVGFSGFPLFAIPRTIVEKIEFRNDSDDGWEDYGCCVDVMFCHDVYENGYSILCDLDLEMHHMKINDAKMQNCFIGIKERKKYFEYKLK